MKTLFREIPYIKRGDLELKKLTEADADALQAMVKDPLVYRYLPTFLYEQKYDDIFYVIRNLYDECLEESLILGVFCAKEFCGLVELYGYRPDIKKISIGCRFIRDKWGQGLARETLGIMVDHLQHETDIEIITASTMIENKGSAKAVMHNGFELVVHASEEDWGFEHPTIVDKWIK